VRSCEGVEERREKREESWKIAKEEEHHLHSIIPICNRLHLATAPNGLGGAISYNNNNIVYL
jgi:hypothetical protein